MRAIATTRFWRLYNVYPTEGERSPLAPGERRLLCRRLGRTQAHMGVLQRPDKQSPVRAVHDQYIVIVPCFDAENAQMEQRGAA